MQPWTFPWCVYVAHWGDTSVAASTKSVCIFWHVSEGSDILGKAVVICHLCVCVCVCVASGFSPQSAVHDHNASFLIRSEHTLQTCPDSRAFLPRTVPIANVRKFSPSCCKNAGGTKTDGLYQPDHYSLQKILHRAFPYSSGSQSYPAHSSTQVQALSQFS